MCVRGRILHFEGTVLTKTTREIQANGIITWNYRLDCEPFLGVSGEWRPDPGAHGVYWSLPFTSLIKSRLQQEREHGCRGVSEQLP